MNYVNCVAVLKLCFKMLHDYSCMSFVVEEIGLTSFVKTFLGTLEKPARMGKFVHGVLKLTILFLL